MGVLNRSDRPVLVMGEEPAGQPHPFIWLAPGARFPKGHDGVAVPGTGLVYKSLGRLVGPVFVGCGATVQPDGRVTGWLTFALRDPAFFDRHPEWRPLLEAAEGPP